jgi:hypothetical protein
MPEIKNSFVQGKMNLDIDERLMPDGEYRNALNVEISASEGFDAGVIKNILSNKRVEELVGNGFKCVGSIANEKSKKLYWFISKYETDAILEYDVDNNISSYVILDAYAGTDKAVLKFFGNTITGINIIDNLLLWTDNYGEPKKINIDTCKAGTYPGGGTTKLVFKNGSFHGITIGLTSYDLGTNSAVAFPGSNLASTHIYVWYEKKRLEAVLNQDIVDDTVHTVRHYRGGVFLSLRTIRVFNNEDGTYFRMEDSTPGVFKVNDVIFGNNIDIDISEQHITVIKPKPLNALTVKINHTESFESTSKIPNLFELKFPRFSYRYKYRDGEFSPFAPFTEPVFNPKYTKDTSRSADGKITYNQDTAYGIKEPYNKAMVNAIQSVDLTDFITAQTPEDVIEIDILYKQEDSSVIYSISTIKHGDSGWHASSDHQGLGLNIGLGKSSNGTGSYSAIGSLTGGKYNVTTENIYAALPSNQLLRPWDNVPRKALAQEVTGSRVVYGNYLQNYNIELGAKVQVSYNNRKNRLGTFDSKGLPSIKSQRNYQLGVVYCDKYGRETPVFTSSDGAVNVPWQDSTGSKNASKSTQLTVGAVNNFPEWVDTFKFFVKETSNQYYNLTMERAWNDESTYELDNSEGHLWISFLSSDRNKISDEDYIILKKKIGVGEKQTTFENKFKVIDIKNEAPEAIKYNLVDQGVITNTNNIFTVAGTGLFPNATDRIDAETNIVRIRHAKWKQLDGVPLEHIQSGSGIDNLPLKTRDLYISWHYIDINQDQQSSSKYKITGGTKETNDYVLNLERTITSEDAAIAYSNSANMRSNLEFQVEKKELRDNENFSGKFFVKISKNQVSSIIETGNEVDDLDKYQVAANQGIWYWQDDVASSYIFNESASNNLYGLTNFDGFDQLTTAGGSYSTYSIQHYMTPVNQSAEAGELKVSDWYECWKDYLGHVQNKPRFFVDAMHMAAGQSETSDYAKYCCITWSGCTSGESASAENSSWSYPPLKTWVSDFETTSNIVAPTGSSPVGSIWDGNNLISTSPVLDEDPDFDNLKIDGWVGPLQNVSRHTPSTTNALAANHINGLGGLITTTSDHSTGPRRWFSGLNGTDYGVGSNTKTYSNDKEEGRHFMHLSFFAPGKDLHDNNWNLSDSGLLYGSQSWAANLQGIWGGGVFTGETPNQKFGTSQNDSEKHFHLAMEGNHDAANVEYETPGPGVGYGYNLNYRRLHERQWDPTFLHNSSGGFIGDPGNKIRDFIRNLYPGSKFRFNGAGIIDNTIYTVKKVTIKKLYNHTSWRKPYNRYITSEGYYPTTAQHIAYQSVEEVALAHLASLNSLGKSTDSVTTSSSYASSATKVENFKQKIVDFGAAHNRRLCYIIELDKNPTDSVSTMGNPLSKFSSSPTAGMSGDINASTVLKAYTDIEFLNPVQSLLLTDLDKFPAIWEIDPRKQDVDLDIYYEASSSIPVKINEKTNELFAPVGCLVEIINATTQQALTDVYLESWDGNKATFNPGFNKGDGTNEINYTNSSFKFIREDGSYTVAEASDQQLTGETDGFKTEFTFKEDIGSVIGVGLGWYNCFSFGNGLESNRIRDDFNETFIKNGVKASTTIQETYEEERRSHGLIFSGIYNSSSGVNDLNQFIMAESITKDLDPTYGSVQKLFQRTVSLIAFCEDKVVQITSNKDAIYNADGSSQLISSNNVLGDDTPFVGDYGISKNPESFASESYRAYFTDKSRGAVLRLSQDGLTPISKNGMHNWFRDNLQKYTSLVGTYDSHTENYNITLSNAYAENIIFNNIYPFEEGINSSSIESSLLNIIQNGVINVGPNYLPSFEQHDIFSDNGFFGLNSLDIFNSNITVVNHPAIPAGYYQGGFIVPDPIFALAYTQDVFQLNVGSYQVLPSSDNGWWYDPSFNSVAGYLFTGSLGNFYPDYSQIEPTLYADSNVDSTIKRVINNITINESNPFITWYQTHGGSGIYQGWYNFFSPTPDWWPHAEKYIAYPHYGFFSNYLQYYNWTTGTGYAVGIGNRKTSMCITRNVETKNIVFDRPNPSNSYVEFLNIGSALTADNHSLYDYNNSSGSNEGHSSFFNGDEIHVQFELLYYPTLNKNGQGFNNFGTLGTHEVAQGYGYNEIIPTLQIFDGSSQVNLDKLCVPINDSPDTYGAYTVGGNTSGNSTYNTRQTTPGAAIGLSNPNPMANYNDYVGISSSSTYTVGPKRNIKNFSNQPNFAFPIITNQSIRIGFWHIPSNNYSDNTVIYQNAGYVATGSRFVTCGVSFKFRDPLQQDSNGNPLISGTDISPTKVIDDLRIRISNSQPAATTGYDIMYENDANGNPITSTYSLRNQLWEIKNVKIVKGFGITDLLGSTTTTTLYDDPTTSTVEAWTASDVLSQTGVLYDANTQQYILNQDSINEAISLNSTALPGPFIPPTDVDAFVEVIHSSYGDGLSFDGFSTSGLGSEDFVSSKQFSHFGNNRTAILHSATREQVNGGGTVTWYEKGPDPIGLVTGTGTGISQVYPFSKTINGIDYIPNTGSLGPTTGDGTIPGVGQYDFNNEWWGVKTASTNDYYDVSWDLTTDYNLNDWYLVDIELDDTLHQAELQNNASSPAIGSGGVNGLVVVRGVANPNGYNGAPVHFHGVGNFAGDTGNKHVILQWRWRDEYEYSTPKWVLRAIYKVHNSSWTNNTTNEMSKFRLRFYGFANNKLHVSKVITRIITNNNGSGWADEWMRDGYIENNNGTWAQYHTLSKPKMYLYSNKLCWDNVYDYSHWSQALGNEISTPSDWILKFELGQNPKTSTFSGNLGVSVTNGIGDYDTLNFSGMSCTGITHTGNYEIKFDLPNATSSFTIEKGGTPYTANLGSYNEVSAGFLTTDSSGQKKIRFYNADATNSPLSAGLSGITLINQTTILEGATIGSWNFDGFEQTLNDYITWIDSTSGYGKIQFTDCPSIDPTPSIVPALITANQFLDKPINRYESYEISYAYKMESKSGTVGEGELLIYYYNSAGYGFRLGNIGDLTSPYGAINTLSNGVKVVTAIVHIGDSLASDEFDSQGVEALRNTFVIRRDNTNTNTNIVTGWINGISMKRAYVQELNEMGDLIYPETTVTFSEDVNGWVSFKSFVPESGLSLSKKYFTLKDAKLYQHYSNNNIDYNNFYGNFYPSTIRAVLNEDSSLIKTFNTINYEGSQAHVTNPNANRDLNGNPIITINNAIAWSENYTDGSGVQYYPDVDGWKVTEIKTDMDAGSLKDFVKKEGKWFGYIKGKNLNNGLDTSRFSVQGIGFATNITSTGGVGTGTY